MNSLNILNEAPRPQLPTCALLLVRYKHLLTSTRSFTDLSADLVAVAVLGVVSRNMRHTGTESRGFRSCAKSTVSGLARTIFHAPTPKPQLTSISFNSTTGPTGSLPTLFVVSVKQTQRDVPLSQCRN